MPRRISREGWAAVLFALARTAVCTYRAATQSVVHDEAFTYLNYVRGPWRDVWTNFDANNHVLFTILTRLSVRLLGLSEFSLRLISVIAGFWLMLGIFRVLELAAIPALMRWTAFLAIGVHPLLLDLSVAARGYGLAIAFLVWAIASAFESRTVLMGTFLGLAISTNLSTLFPAIGLLLARFVLSRDSIVTRGKQLIRSGALIVMIFAAVCAGLIPSMIPERFVSAGLPAIRRSIESLVVTSILGTPHPGLFGTYAAALFLQFIMLPLMTLLVALAGVRMFRGDDAARARFLPGAALGFACLLMMAGHYLLRLNYPVDRSGLPFVVLAGISWAIAAGEFRSYWMLAANAIFGAALLCQFVTQDQTYMFQTWFYDRSTKSIALRIAEECRDKPAGSVRISATWLHEPALEFYRVYENIAALQPVERRDEIRLTGFDYYVLNGPDSQAPQVAQKEILFSDSEARVILARDK